MRLAVIWKFEDFLYSVQNNPPGSAVYVNVPTLADERVLVYLFLSVCLHLIVFLWVNTCVNKLSRRRNRVSQMNRVSRRYVLGLMSSKQKHTRATLLWLCFRFAWSTSGRAQSRHMFRMPRQWFSSLNMEARAEVSRMLKYVPEPFHMLGCCLATVIDGQNIRHSFLNYYNGSPKINAPFNGCIQRGARVQM